MQRLIHGIRDFQSRVFTAQRELVERLATGQKPDTLLITCSDSVIDPKQGQCVILTEQTFAPMPPFTQLTAADSSEKVRITTLISEVH